MNSPQKKTPNRLIHEKSPYLLQHAYNPVDWRAWNEEAFAIARSENKPIFLSIGYSTCHWCHVMEHESFENEDVARLMNATFVSIKVDREERPDVDNIYMTVCQMLTGHGGWPLTVILTPDKKPFFAGTYIPRETSYGRVGMLDFIPRIQEIWTGRRDEVDRSATEIADALRAAAPDQAGQDPDARLLDAAFQQFRERFDPNAGGFGQQPKFPTPHNLIFLVRYWHRTGQVEALEMAQKTLREMRRGGIFDHIGKGFHRYATDAHWFLPHFEKMLYDQALLVMAALETYRASAAPEFAATAREILSYVSRDLMSPDGVFYSAEDADSEGVEGKFYVWTAEETREVLGAADAERFMRVHGFMDDGNFFEEATRQKTGENIVFLPYDLETSAANLGLSVAELSSFLEQAHAKLFAVRAGRVRPHLDDKVLIDWNGLMISAFARAARALEDAEYARIAGTAAAFLLAKMRRADGRLLHRYRDGDAAIDGLLDDYAFFCQGLLDLYETTFDFAWLEQAIDLAQISLRHFWDAANGGFFFTPDDGEDLIVRRKEVYDGAVPSGNSVAVLNFVRIARMTGDAAWEDRARQIGRAFAKTLESMPSAHAQFLTGLDFALGPSLEIVVAGEAEAEDTKALLAVAARTYVPRSVTLLRTGDSRLRLLAPFTAHQGPVNGQAAAYVCRNFACEAPVTDPAKMIELLRAGKI